jgi:hypothetical protein
VVVIPKCVGAKSGNRVLSSRRVDTSDIVWAVVGRRPAGFEASERRTQEKRVYMIVHASSDGASVEGSVVLRSKSKFALRCRTWSSHLCCRAWLGLSL